MPKQYIAYGPDGEKLSDCGPFATFDAAFAYIEDSYIAGEADYQVDPPVHEGENKTWIVHDCDADEIVEYQIIEVDA